MATPACDGMGCERPQTKIMAPASSSSGTRPCACRHVVYMQIVQCNSMPTCWLFSASCPIQPSCEKANNLLAGFFDDVLHVDLRSGNKPPHELLNM